MRALRRGGVGTLQNFARKHRLAIDLVSMDYEVRDQDGQCDERPLDGVLARGLFIEGCRWDPFQHVLVESEPKVLFVSMPVIWLKPMLTKDIVPVPSYR
jgi:dynein heavy chain